MTAHESQFQPNNAPSENTPTEPNLSVVPAQNDTAHEQQDGPLYAASTADVLAYIECTLGFRPTNSLVLVAFAEQHLSTVVRCDLPEAIQQMLRSDTPESVTFMDLGITEQQELQWIDLGRRIGRLLTQEPSTTRCLVLYLADTVTVSDQQALTVVGTANGMIAAQFGLQQLPVDEAWLIHHDQLWHLRCNDTTECQSQGVAVADPRTSGIYHRLDPTGLIASELTTPQRQLVFPPGLRSQPELLPDGPELHDQPPRVVVDWLDRWDAQLHHGPSMMHTDEASIFLAALQIPAMRDAIRAAACFDVPTAIRGMVAIDRFSLDIAQHAGLEPRDEDGRDVAQCFYGRSQRVPNWRRIGTLEILCLRLLPLADTLSGVGLLGLLVWIEWARGRGSVALHYLQQAQEHLPASPQLSQLHNIVIAGTVAEWATRADSAWTPQRAA